MAKVKYKCKTIIGHYQRKVKPNKWKSIKKNPSTSDLHIQWLRELRNFSLIFSELFHGF